RKDWSTKPPSSGWCSPPRTCARAPPPSSASASRCSAGADRACTSQAPPTARPRPALPPTPPRCSHCSPTATPTPPRLPGWPPRPAPDPAQLLALLADGDLDAALDAGLIALDVEAAAGLDHAARALLAQAQQRLRTAWAARERYRARTARLARRAARREARRTA